MKNLSIATSTVLLYMFFALSSCSVQDEKMATPAPSTLYIRPLSTHPSQGPVRTVKSSTAMLVITKKGALAHVATTQLVPGNVYTLWWVVINRPKACATSPCTPPDVLKHTAATNADVAYGDSIIARKNGEGRFNSFLAVGNMPNSWFGNGYRNPRGAEIHLVVNDHGPLVPDLAHSMLNSYRGGCTDESLPPPFPASAKADGTPGPNTCRLVQDVGFVQ